jgi:hypothetical protein
MFPSELKKMGCWVLGDEDSPVIPILLHHPRKISSFSRFCLDKGIASVCVAYPATPLLEGRLEIHHF